MAEPSHELHAAFLALADRCERAAPMDHAALITEANLLAAEALATLHGGLWQDRYEEALRLVDAGASENAVLALIPPSADVTAGTFSGRSSLIAQVFVPGWGKSHSREARSLAMAWLAAFLRALADGYDAVPEGDDLTGMAQDTAAPPPPTA